MSDQIRNEVGTVGSLPLSDSLSTSLAIVGEIKFPAESPDIAIENGTIDIGGQSL